MTAGTKKIRRVNTAMTGLIYAAASITIAVLLLILGYIIYNGLFYKIRVEYAELPYASERLEDIVVAVNRDIDLEVMQFEVLKGMFTDEYANWKRTGASAADVYPYQTQAAAAVTERLFGGTGRLVETVSANGRTSAQQTAAFTASKEGGIAVMLAEEYEALSDDEKKALRKVPVRALVLACSADTAALHGNYKLGAIDGDMLSRIASGQTANWQELGGGDLPVTVLLPPKDAPFIYSLVSEKDAEHIRAFFDSAEQSSAETGAPRIIRADSAQSFYASLAAGTGVVTVAPEWQVPEAADMLRCAGTEQGLNLNWSFLTEAPIDGGRSGGISTIIINTFVMIALTLVCAVPFGIFAAVYLVLYAKEGRLLYILRLGTETLAGIPSIIFGLFGMLVFVQALGWGISLLSGCLTLALMILPTIVRTSEEAIKAVSPALNEGSVALGATKVQTIFKVVLPSAFPAITAGVILAAGRALGETAALIYTMGSNYNLTSGLFDSTRTLAVHLYLIIAEGISSEKAFAAATVLVVLVFIINSLSKLIIKRLGSR